MAHYVEHNKIYVDTGFVNDVQKLPGVTLNHMGFGEFSLDTPKGKVEFDRMRGKPFEGQVGRSMAMYDRDGGDSVAREIVKQMEHHNFSTAAAGSLKLSSRDVASYDRRSPYNRT